MNDAARSILRANDRGGYTIPTARLYPYQWNWDAGFTALGWATIDEARAWLELSVLFQAQWNDGLLPHIVFHVSNPDYFPGPEVWDTAGKAPIAGSGISQPPVSATIVRWLLEQANDRELANRQATALFPKLFAHHSWWHSARDPEGTGLVCSYHPWETGRDNSPEWDQPFTMVPKSESEFRRRDTDLVDSSQRPLQDEYQRYVYLVELFRSFDYDSQRLYENSPFKIVDIGINSILARADQDLLVLAAQFGTEQQQDCIRAWVETTRQAIQTLWNPALGCFNGYDLLAQRQLDMPVSAGFLPLFAGLADSNQAEQMAQTLERWRQSVCYLVPSLAPDHPLFEPQRYWRGPVWSIVNFMIASGLLDYGYDALASQVRADVLTLNSEGDFHEYFDPMTGQGCGGDSFSWTAAVALWWLRE